MLWQRKVSCINCGFLYWQIIGRFSPDISEPYRPEEISEHEREEMKASDIEPPYSPYLENEETGGITRLDCLRNQWIMLPKAKRSGYYSSIEEVIKNRKCVYYMKYMPGFNPEEHKELQREEKTRKEIFKATLIGAIIGALAAIVAQVMYLILTR